jgi:hypothetical protein
MFTKCIPMAPESEPLTQPKFRYRFGLPAFYTLHVWAWKDNPSGAFVNWHPKVSCDAFAGR